MITVTWYGAVQKAYTPEPAPVKPSSYISYRIEADQNEVQDSVNLTVQGSILVETGGKLTISNSTVWMDSEEDGLQRIDLMDGAELDIENSTIRAKDPSLRYEFVVRGTLFIDNSTIRDLYGYGKVGGIQIYSRHPVEIKNSRVDRALTSGIYIYNGTPVLNNVTITNASTGLYIYSPTSPGSGPQAVITNTEDILRTDDVASFSGTSSTGNNLRYLWDFGDGYLDSGSQVQHTYELDGVYNCRLTVTDDSGMASNCNKTIYVLNALPRAVAYCNPVSSCINGTVTYFGQKSYDNDGSIMEYRWNFDDGATVLGSVVKHGLGTSGTHMVNLTVTDNDGDFNTTALYIDINTNHAPVADAGIDQITFLGRAAIFVGGRSSDQDGTIVNYTWDYGDVSALGYEVYVSHNYTDEGIYIARLTVTDNSSYTGEDTAVVQVKSSSWMQYREDSARTATGEGDGPSHPGGPMAVTGAQSLPSGLMGQEVDSGIAINDSMLFVGTGHTFAGYNSTTMLSNWTYFSTYDTFYTSPAIYGDYVYIVSKYSNGGNNGVMIYCFEATPADPYPMVDDGYDDPGGVTYDILWERYFSGYSSYASPLVSNGAVYIVMNDGSNNIYIYAFDAAGTLDGFSGENNPQYCWEVLWWRQLPGTGQITYTPALDSNTLVIPLTNGQSNCLYGLNLTDNWGSIQWLFPASSKTALSPAIYGNQAVVALTNGSIYILNLWNGSVIKSYTNDTITNPISTILSGNQLYISYGTSVAALNVSDRISVNWTYQFQNGLSPFGEMCLMGKYLYIPASNATGGILLAMNTTNGSAAYTCDIGLNHAPVSGARGSLYMHNMWGNLTKFEGQDPIPWQLDYSATLICSGIGEVGNLTGVTSDNMTVTLNNIYTNPVVIAEPMSFNGSDPGHTRIKSAAGDQFTMAVEEWNAVNNRSHLEGENVSYIVMEAGHYPLPGGGYIEAGTANVDNTGWKSVSFSSPFPGNPVVLTQTQTKNSNDPVITRTKNIDTNHFEVTLQKEAGGSSTAEKVAYIAWSRGLDCNNDNNLEINNTTSVVTDSWYTLNFNRTYPQPPIFIAWSMTFNESDAAGVRYRNLNNTSVQVKMEEATVPPGAHNGETVGYFALTCATQVVGKISIATYLNGNSVEPFQYAPDFEGGMKLAASHVQTWRKTTGPSAVNTAERYLFNASINMTNELYYQAIQNAKLGCEALVNSSATWSNSTDALLAAMIISNSSMNSTFDEMDYATYTVGYQNADVIAGWQDANQGVLNQIAGNYTYAITDYYNAMKHAVTALSCLQPDLMLHMNDFIISKYDPAINETINLTATVVNRGLGTAPQSILQFYLGDPTEPGAVQIGNNTTIPSLAYCDVYTIPTPVTFSCSTKGSCYLFAAIDTANAINETNEDNNIISKAVKITDGFPFPTMSNMLFRNDSIGLMVDGNINGYSVRLQSSFFQDNTVLDIKGVNASSIETYDTYYTRNLVQMTGVSVLDKYWSLTMNTFDSARNLAPNTSVAYTPAGGSQTTGASDANGAYTTNLREARFTASGPTYYTPHLVEIDPSGNGNSKATVVMDGPRSLNIFKRATGASDGDADLDALPDNTENNLEKTYWMEAENHVYSNDQLHLDYNAYPVGLNGYSVKERSSDDRRIINPNSFMNMTAGYYMIYARAKYLIHNEAHPGGSPTQMKMTVDNSYGIFQLTNDYQWYHLFNIVHNNNSAIPLNITAETLAPLADIFVDRILFQQWKNQGQTIITNLGQATDPATADVDNDRIPDGYEVRATSYWYEAEDFVTQYGTTYDNSNASNAKEVRPNSASSPPVISIGVSGPTNTYIVYIRARSFGGVSYLKLIVNGNTLAAAPMVSDTAWKWYTFQFSGVAPTTLGIYVLTNPNIAIDTIHFDCKERSYVSTLINAQANPVSQFTISSSSDGTYYLRLPKDQFIANSTLTLHQSGMKYQAYDLPSNTYGKDPAIDGDIAVYVNVTNNNYLYAINVSKDPNGNGLPAVFETGDTKNFYQLTSESSLNPSISGHYIAYQNATGVKLIDFDTNLNGVPDFQEGVSVGIYLLNGSATASPCNPDISGTTVVWQKGKDIFAYDIKRGLPPADGSIFNVTASPTTTYTNPRISGDNVVYNDTTNVYVTGLSSWATGYNNPRDVNSTARTGGNSNVTQTVAAGSQADIHGQYIAWKGSSTTVKLKALFQSESILTLYTAAGGSTVDNIKVEGDKVMWNESVPNAGNTQYYVKMYDLAQDSDNDGIPNYLESPLVDATSTVYSPSQNTIVSNADVCGNYVLWDYGTAPNTKVGIARTFFGIDVGDAAFSYNSCDFAVKRLSGSTYNTKNFVEAVNNWIKTHQGGTWYVDVPLIFHTETPTSVTVNMDEVDAFAGFATNTLNNDTDGDGLDDGAEFVDYFGVGVIECEDVMYSHEWKNPYAESGAIRTKDPIFISQTGVTLTSTHNYAGTEGTRSSFITIPYRAPSTGSFKLTVVPDQNVSQVTDTLWFPQYVMNGSGYNNSTNGSVGDYVPVELNGYDVDLGGGSDFMNNTVAQAVTITVREAGGDVVNPTNQSLGFDVNAIRRGVLIGAGDGSAKGMVYITLGFWGKYDLVKNTNYEITLSVDLDRVSSFQPANGDPFTDLAMLRVLSLDYIRVDRQTLDPLTTDYDGDGLTDGQEASGGFPLSSDADHDGLTDYEELVTYRTDPMRRDTDGDGVRDGVELGLQSSHFINQGTANETFGSWTERIARYGTPYKYDFLPTYDADPSTTTDPNAPDSDGDGLPDGWIDAWTYRMSPLDPREQKTYQDSLDLAKIEMRYDATRWMNGGEPNNLVQVYEGEDLNCDGSRDSSGSWNFTNDTQERNGTFAETDPCSADTDSDGVPDGYEVWYSSSVTPLHMANGSLYFSPTVNDAYRDDDIVPQTIQNNITMAANGPTMFGLETGSTRTAIAQRVNFGAGSVFGNASDIPTLKQIQVQLNMSRATSLMATLEIWDNRLDSVNNSVPDSTLKPLCRPIPFKGTSDGWYTFDVPVNVFCNNPPGNTVFYIVIRSYNSNLKNMGWYYHDPPQGGTGFNSMYQGIDNKWHRDGTDLLYNLKFLNSTNSAGDKLPLIAEYIAGTNPKNPNSDYISIGTQDKRGSVNDYLLDGYECGWDAGENKVIDSVIYPDPKGGVIFRTNVANGATGGASYTGEFGQRIYYDPDGGSSDLWKTAEYAGDGNVIDPASTDESLFSENVLILTLGDGTQVYQRPDGVTPVISNELFIFMGGLNKDDTYYDENGTQRVCGFLVKFKYDQVNNNNLSLAHVEDTDASGHNFVGRQLFLADPTEPDTDMDGVPDGLETQRAPGGNDYNITSPEFDHNGWKNDSEMNFPGQVYDDGMVNARDQDSDNDGLLDSQEVPYFLACNGSLWANYANPDSDGDGVLDGNEVKPTENSDDAGPGNQTATLYLGGTPDVSSNLYDFFARFNPDANMFDPDSDNDGVSDGAELNPFLLIDNRLNASQSRIDTSATFLEGVNNAHRLAVAGNRDIYYADGSAVYVLTGYDRFNNPGANEGRVVVNGNGVQTMDIAVSGSSYVYYLRGASVYQYCIASQTAGNDISLSDLGSVKGITVDSDGLVYAAVEKDGKGSIYKLDFSGDKVNKTKINSDDITSSINDIAIDGNKNIMIASGSYVYQITSPTYTWSTKWTLAQGAGTITQVCSDANGGIYYADDAYNFVNVIYLRPDYTHTYLKNRYFVQNLTSVVDCAGIDVGSQYDLIIADSHDHKICGFVGSKSDPTKKDSDGDGREDGFGDPSNPYDGELDTNFSLAVNHTGMSYSNVMPRPTFPTIADSDNDGISDGAEVQPYNITVKTLVGNTSVIGIRSDPSRYDTDSDGLNDGIERNFTNAIERDTDQDGIPDGSEDANHDGKVEVTETSPVVMDSDGDGLADGWCDLGVDGVFGTHDPYESDGIWESANESMGEDFNWNGAHDANEPNPLKWDTDGDTLSDGIEVQYLINLGGSLNFNHDSDADGKPDVIETDADADGLNDNLENRNGDTALQANESNPYNYDTDGDGLPDGVEPSPFRDIDNDTRINVNDTDSNNDTYSDFVQTFVLFRTLCKDTNSDGMIEYASGLDLATFKINNPNVKDMNETQSLLVTYKYISTESSLPGGASLINVSIGLGNPVPLRTPDGLFVYLQTGGTCHIYLRASDSVYYKYEEATGRPVSTNAHVLWSNYHHNEISDHQITVDTRNATSTDVDFDGLNDYYDTNTSSRDTDNDGVIDGKDFNATNPDTDGDGLTDGLELGITIPVPGIGTNIAGTCTTATFIWQVNGWSVTVHNFTADSDPTIVTDLKNNDTDGDGIPDGVEDCDMMNLSLGSHILKSTDLNGKYDGMLCNETNPLDKDSDDDGLTDGIEDVNHNGMWDGNLTTHIGETCSWNFDTDSDGLGDGIEVGKVLWNITTDTNTSVFIPDSDTNTTTNPLAIDSDGDGLPDGWIDGWNMTSQGVLGKSSIPDMEFQTWEGEDRNLNGKFDAGETNPNSLDSDGDHLADGWDIVTSTTYSNLFTRDTSGMKRYWGELNYTTHQLTISGSAIYQSGPTDPTYIDSDGDGLVDGDTSINGLPCELVTSHNNVQQTMYTDPSLMDTDGDGLSDGMEIAGWEVHIIKESSKMEVRNWTVSSNPTIMDSDSDGVNDYHEFENQSDPNCNDTDGDYILDSDEIQGSLTQIDSAPPQFLKWETTTQFCGITFKFVNQLLVQVIEHKDGWGFTTSKEIKITVHLYDPSGLNYARFILEGQKDQTIPIGNYQKYANLTAKFSYDEWRGFTDGFDIKVQAFDLKNNGNSTTTHLDGFVEGVTNAIIKLFKWIGDAVLKALSAIFDWIWNAIRSLMQFPIKLITLCAQRQIMKFFQLLARAYDEFDSSGKISTTMQDQISEILEDFPVIGTLVKVINSITNMIKPFLDCISSLLNDAINFISKLITGKDKSNEQKYSGEKTFFGMLDWGFSTFGLSKYYSPGRMGDADFVGLILGFAFASMGLAFAMGALDITGTAIWLLAIMSSVLSFFFYELTDLVYQSLNSDQKQYAIIIQLVCLFIAFGFALGGAIGAIIACAEACAEANPVTAIGAGITSFICWVAVFSLVNPIKEKWGQLP